MTLHATEESRGSNISKKRDTISVLLIKEWIILLKGSKLKEKNVLILTSQGVKSKKLINSAQKF